MGEAKQKKVDKSLEMTFPASDPPASGRSTGTEPPTRPTNRQAPLASKEQIEAATGSGRSGRSERGRRPGKRHRGVGRDGMQPGEEADEIDKRKGLGRKGDD
jgi:hypothetical protein